MKQVLALGEEGVEREHQRQGPAQARHEENPGPGAALVKRAAEIAACAETGYHLRPDARQAVRDR